MDRPFEQRPAGARHGRAHVLFAGVVLLLSACAEDSDFTAQRFVSDLPANWRDGAPPDNNAGDGDGEGPSVDPGRMIEEADIVQVVDGRLYALSRYGGLHVIDVSSPGELTWLGSFRNAHDAEPFEMYLRDGIAFVMYTSWGQYERNDTDDGYRWVQSSKLVVLDASDPEAIEELTSFTIPGAISDSRIVGDVLYVVGYQDGYCWGCAEARPLTSIVSLDVSDPSEVLQVDELQYEDDDNTYGWNKRSIHVTSERMYVAGIEYGDEGPRGSTIQVVDISDPSGALVETTHIEAEGQISSRWQMDEHAGVLRVLSQPPAWDLQQPPVVQTFTIESSEEIVPLGRGELILPRPEQLQSVRFDGERAYAITFERTDPLFTIDLSDPSQPVQRGSLEMPGFVYYMEPRGDRVIGLGFDQGNAAGAITVSLFDVSDLARPAMLSRVNFGGSWGSLPEDQDRIHKVFRVLDALGLILVPHSGWQESTCGRSGSGVQLVGYDVDGDALALLGAVPSRGEARRALVIDDQLLTVSDERVESYDISDRAAPVLSAYVAMTRNVMRTVPLASGAVARISQDFWDARSLLVDFPDADEVENVRSAQGEVEVGALLRSSGDTCNSYVWLHDTFAMGDNLVIAYRSEQWDDAEDKGRAGLLVIDASDPAAPEVLTNTDWRFDYGWWWFDGFYDYGVPATRAAIVHTETAVVMLETSYSDGESKRWLRVIDLSDPAAPDSTVVDLEAYGGQGGLLVDGNTVVMSHYEADAGGDGVRFFLDRIDVSNPSSPEVLTSINVPGTVLHFDGAANRAVTVDLVRVGSEDMSYEDCSARFATYEYDWSGDAADEASCTGYRQRIHLVQMESAGARLLDTYEVDEDQALRASSIGDDIMYATVGTGAYYGGIAVDCWGPCGYYPSEPSTLITLAGLSRVAFETGVLELDDNAWWGWWSPAPVHAVGRHAIVIGQDDLVIVDATEASGPHVDRTEPLGGYVQHVSTTPTDAFLSLGAYGARRIEVR